MEIRAAPSQTCQTELEALRDRVAALEAELRCRQASEAALRENERNLWNFFNTSDHLLFILDEQGCILHANNTVYQRLGYTAQELVGQSVLLVHPPDRREEAGRIVADMLAGRADYCPIPLQTKEGRQIPVETRVQPGEWSGRPAIFGITKDLSGLKASEEKFAKAFESSPALMAITDLDTNQYIDVNTVFLSTLGFTREDVIGHTASELNLFANPEQRALALQTLQERGQLRNFDVAVRAKSGKIHHGLFAAEIIQLQDRRVLLTVMNDITERKHLEAALRASEEKFRRVVEEARDALSLCDEEGHIIEWNHSAEVLTGIERAEALGQPYWEIHWRLLRPERRSPDVLEKLEQQVRQALQTGHAPFMDKPIIAQFQRADGEYRIVLQNSFSIKTARGYWLGGTSLDITDLKRTEAALSQLNAQLEQRVAERTRELIEANLRLTELDRLKDEFISRINHELRTPLTSIKAYVELLTFGKPEKHDKYIHIIAEQTERLQTIIESLLEVPQLRVGDVDVKSEQAEINALVNGLCANRQSAASRRGVQLQARLTDSLPSIMTDKTLVLRALLNVVTNALNYTPTGGTITLTTGSHTEGDRRWVTIAVADTGPGISDKDRPYIFEPFYRGEASNDYKTPGTGVGLFTAQRLLETLGGKIVVDSQPGAGATFTLWLPDGPAAPPDTAD